MAISTSDKHQKHMGDRLISGRRRYGYQQYWLDPPGKYKFVYQNSHTVLRRLVLPTSQSFCEEKTVRSQSHGHFPLVRTATVRILRCFHGKQSQVRSLIFPMLDIFKHTRRPQQDLRLVPFAIAGLSLTIEVLYALICALLRARQADDEESEETSRTTRRHRIREHIQYYGGYTIYGFMVARLVGTLLLLHLSTDNASKCQPTKGWLGLRNLPTECPDYILSLTFVSRRFKPRAM